MSRLFTDSWFEVFVLCGFGLQGDETKGGKQQQINMKRDSYFVLQRNYLKTGTMVKKCSIRLRGLRGLQK